MEHKFYKQVISFGIIIGKMEKKRRYEKQGDYQVK
jgi:hypothetical protein